MIDPLQHEPDGSAPPRPGARQSPDEDAPQVFEALSETRCRELLAGHSVGRVAWQAADGLQILPVSYAWDEGTVVFRTSPYGVLSELVRATDVVLEIDELDEKCRQGWSVVVRGRTRGVAEPGALVRMWALDGLVPWATGVRNLFIAITPQKISGRALDARPARV